MSSNTAEHLINSLPTGEWQVVTADSSEAPVTQLDERMLRIAGNLEVDHRGAGFAARRLPRRVRLLATIVLTRAPAIP